MKIITSLTVTLVLLASAAAQEKKEPPAGLKQLVSQVAKERKEILQLFEDFKKAFKARDLDAIMSLYDVNVVAYDISPPLEYRGRENYRKAWQAFFDAYQGPVEVEIKEPTIGFSGGLAYSINLECYRGVLKSGEKSEIWVRITDVYHKVGGKWQIVHEHVSVPTDFETGKSMLDLKP